MPYNGYEIVKDRARQRFGVKEGRRLADMYIRTVQYRKKYFTGADEFFDFVHDWEEATKRIKSSGVSMANVLIVGVPKMRE